MNKRQEISSLNPLIRQIDPSHPEPPVVEEAAAVIRAGGIVVFPTRTLYGLGVDAANPTAIRRLFQVKGRDMTKPVSVLIKSREMLADLAEDIPPQAIPIMDRFWPGRVTLVFRAKISVCSLLTAGTGKIGVRLPDHPVAISLLRRLESPLTATSANFSSSPGVHRIDSLTPNFLRQMDMVLDAGPLGGGAGSTVLDVTCDPPRVLREGTIPIQFFQDIGS